MKVGTSQNQVWKVKKKGHKQKNYTLEVDLCHRCHQPDHIRTNCTQSTIRMIQTSKFVVLLDSEGTMLIPTPKNYRLCNRFLGEKEPTTNEGAMLFPIKEE